MRISCGFFPVIKTGVAFGNSGTLAYNGGELTLSGTEQAVTGNVGISYSGDRVVAQGSTEFNPTDLRDLARASGYGAFKYIHLYTQQPLAYDEHGFGSDGSYLQPELATGETGSYYLIQNAGNLFWFSEHVSEGGGNASANAVLAGDIVIPPAVSYYHIMAPIGTVGSERPVSYAGTFDGRGHSIDGLRIGSAKAAYTGLFANVGAGGAVKNVSLQNLTVHAGTVATGAIAGISSGAIENCQVLSGTVYHGSSAESTTMLCGGVVGALLGGGTVSHCSNAAEIRLSDLGGGDPAACCGGIVGSIVGGAVSDCYSIGAIIGLNNMGGIAGSATGGTISNCFSTSSFDVRTGGGSGVDALVGGGASSVDATGCYYLASEGGPASSYGQRMTADQFSSGEVAWLLNGGSATGEDLVWGQTLEGGAADAHPVFNDGGNTVHYGYEGCWSQTPAYSNEQVSEEKPEHDFSGEWFSDDFGHWKQCGNEGCEVASVVEDHIPAAERVNAKPATETEEGYTGDVVCSTCGRVIEKGQPIDKLTPPDPEPGTDPDQPGIGGGDEGNTPGSGDEGGNPGSGGEGDGDGGQPGTGSGDEGSNPGSGDEGNTPGSGDEGVDRPGTGSGEEGDNPGSGAEGEGGGGEPGSGDGDEADGDEGQPGSGSSDEGDQSAGSDQGAASQGSVNDGTLDPQPSDKLPETSDDPTALALAASAAVAGAAVLTVVLVRKRHEKFAKF